MERSRAAKTVPVWRGVKRAAGQRSADAQRWTRQRLAGTTVAEIAKSDGVSPATVSRATSAGITGVARRVAPSTPQVEVWARRRRDGVSVAELAREAGTSEKRIRRVTRELGPYPRAIAGGAGPITVEPAVVRRWVQDRRSAVSTVAIARDSETTAATVRQATKGYGPFPSPQRAPVGYLTFRQVGARLGISRPALQRRLDNGELPTPAGYSNGHRDRDSGGDRGVDGGGDSEGGWPYWRAGDIEQWITELSLDRCPICAAYLKRLDWHMISRHQQPRQRRLAGATAGGG